jgi:hypothetical protein
MIELSKFATERIDEVRGIAIKVNKLAATLVVLYAQHSVVGISQSAKAMFVPLKVKDYDCLAIIISGSTEERAQQVGIGCYSMRDNFVLSIYGNVDCIIA